MRVGFAPDGGGEDVERLTRPKPGVLVDHGVYGALEQEAFVGFGGFVADRDDLLGQVADN